MKKLLYIGHAFHNKTKSTQFLQDLLKEKYCFEVFDFDPYEDDMVVHFEALQNKSYDVIVLFQIMPDLGLLKKIIDVKKIVLFPMYDGAPSVSNSIWISYKEAIIINFSKTLHEGLKNLGLCSYYIQFFPKPAEVVNWGDHEKIFFWQRINQITIETLLKVFSLTSIKGIHIHKATDPEHTFKEPPRNMDLNVTCSTWYSKREEMMRDVEGAAFYFAPRESEGIGMSFLEAMALGRCVVAPDNPTMNEYISNGMTGFLYDLKNPQPIVVEDIQRIQTQAYEYIKKGHEAWDREKQKILEWIEAPVIIDEKKIKKADRKTAQVSRFYQKTKQGHKRTIILLSFIKFSYIKKKKKRI